MPIPKHSQTRKQEFTLDTFKSHWSTLCAKVIGSFSNLFFFLKYEHHCPVSSGLHSDQLSMFSIFTLLITYTTIQLPRLLSNVLAFIYTSKACQAESRLNPVALANKHTVEVINYK